MSTEAILTKIIIRNTNKLVPDDKLLRDHLGITIFKDLERVGHKRKVEEFLEDYNQKVEFNDTESIGEDGNELDQSEEKNQALSKLNFVLDRFYRKVLKAHQVEGVQFMWNRVFLQRQGCLLAHSMGLGKSLQTVALLTTLYQQLKKYPSINFPTGKRVLMIVPLITLTNWLNEFSKWSVADSENVIGEVFNIAELGQKPADRMKYIRYWYTHGGVMLITYDLFRILITKSGKDEEKEEYFKMMINPGADLVVLDEGHRIKNSASMISILVNQIRTRARICLTGYPLQNHLLEYYYMISFVAPELLGSEARFKSYFSNIIEKCYTDSSINHRYQAAMKMYVLQLLTDTVTQRKDDTILVKQLPPKTEYIVKFKLSPIQYEGYTNLVDCVRSETPLVSLLVLRAMCNHPKIFYRLLKNRQVLQRNANFRATAQVNSTEKDNQDTLETIIVEDDEEDAFSNWLSRGYEWAIDYLEKTDIESWKVSGKISFIVDLAKECQVVKDKLVLVSHSIACLNYIQDLMPVFGIKVSRIDGSTPGGERQSIIDTFEVDESADIMLLSAKAAAIGINLTAANRIVLIDQDWNPLYDEQSIGRIFRYGQTKPVFVYRLLIAHTIEERICMQSIHKRSISRRVVDNKAALSISREELSKYYQIPPLDTKLIVLDAVDKQIKKDLVTYSALRQNANCISSMDVFDPTIVKQNDQDTLFTIKSEADRDAAKKEALDLLKKARAIQTGREKSWQ